MTVVRRIVSSLCLSLFFLSSATVHADDLLKRGKRIAEEGNRSPGSVACMECHRLHGGGMPSIGSPRIAGQTPVYIEHEILGVQKGTRYAPVMAGVVNNLSRNDIRAVARYYASVRTPKIPDVSPPDPALVALGKRIARKGLWKKNVPACVLCHGPDGRGVPPHFPYIKGQNKGYLLRQLVSFAFLKRKDDPQGLMRGIARRLTQKERKAVAEYFASLTPPAVAGRGK
ncbi:MAG: c-type cytochrome [Nitrospirae bacterium]|nr:c-type cytochrome [Nitrospirota bacterium]MCL5285495.1 c-type cytochrome [Nitrospirota bacterium]